MLAAVEVEELWKKHEVQEADAYQYEYRPAIAARELLDSENRLYYRAARLVAEKRAAAGERQETDNDPMTDLLGGARMAVAFMETGHPDAEAAFHNHENDIRTAYTEALLKSGHISEVVADVNDMGEATIGNVAHWEIFLRAAPKIDPEICTAEIAEEFILASLYNKPYLRDNYFLAVVSPPRTDTKGTSTMVRLIGFEQDTSGRWVRKTQQLYVGNGNVEDANRLLEEWGVSDGRTLNEIGVLSKPVLLRKRHFKEVSTTAKMLDTFTAERTGQPVFCGVPMDMTVEDGRYAELLSVSRRREVKIAPEVGRLARDVYDIVAKKHLSFADENRAYSNLLLASLRRICSDHPEYAEAAFGSEAAQSYYEAHRCMADGDGAGAEAALSNAYDSSTSVTICDTTVEESQVQSQETGEQVIAEREEALHCLELKIKGYTIRKNVRCPACYETTKRKVDAYETVTTIRCMSKNCGYCINKETGAVISKSNIKQAGKTKKEATPEKQLQSGRSYRLGATNYYYVRERVGGEHRPRLTTDAGEHIRGEAAQHLEQAIIAMQKVPLLWMLWLYSNN